MRRPSWEVGRLTCRLLQSILHQPAAPTRADLAAAAVRTVVAVARLPTPEQR